MKQLVVNIFAFMIISLGGLSLAASNASANIQECKSGWELQCDAGECCTVCQDTGKIGDCT